jgi:hypothetical protein
MKQAKPAIRRVRESELPSWLVRAERLLLEAQRTIRLLGSATPRNAERERERLLAAVESGTSKPTPRWSYARTDHSLLRRALEKAASRLAAERTGLADLYAARARELEIEAAIASEVGTSVVGALARGRFGPASAELAREATELAKAWIAEPVESRECAVKSDGPEPESLVSRLRDAVAQMKLPFDVVVHPQLVSLAAVGDRHIMVAAGRMLTKADVDRTVLHEIEAHALPRGRAANARIGLFQLGTARGTCDQEGLALVLEERHGFLGGFRRRQLAARHLVVDAMDHGASFADALALLGGWGFAPADAVMMAERAYRGGTGESPGLGRERVYLEAYLRVRAHLAKKPTDEAVLSAGQVAIGATEILRPLM